MAGDVTEDAAMDDVDVPVPQYGEGINAVDGLNDDGHSGSRSAFTAGATGGATLLRRNVYTGASKMKFKPQMVRRQGKADVPVKQEAVEASISLREIKPKASTSTRGKGRGGANQDGIGGGRGRGGEVQMQATGSFAYGPSAQPKDRKQRAKPSTGGDSRSNANAASSSARRGGNSDSATKSVSTAQIALSDDDDGSDAGEAKTDGKLAATDLDQIGLEGEMAPLVLPKDWKKWDQEQVLREEYARAMDKLSLKPKLGSGTSSVRAISPAGRVKADPYEEDEAASASLAAKPHKPVAGTSGNELLAVSDGDENMEVSGAHGATMAAAPAATLGADDVAIRVKRENIAPFFDLGPGDEHSTPEQYHILQFPRLFPTFYDPDDESQAGKFSPAALAAAALKVKKEEDDSKDKSKLNVLANASSVEGNEPVSAKYRIKSALHESEAEAWRTYEPGKWQGWGRNPGQRDRENLAGNPDAQGLIGKIKIRRSGKVTMKLGSISYDISAGTPINFLQELAVLRAEDTEHPSMFVLNQPTRKFVVAPNLHQLFKLDAIELVERRRKAEEDARQLRIKREEDEAKKAATLAAEAKKTATSRSSGAASARQRGSTAPGRGRTRPSATPAPNKKS